MAHLRVASLQQAPAAVERARARCNTRIAYCGYRTYTAFTRTCLQAFCEVRRFLLALRSLPALKRPDAIPAKPRKWLRHPFSLTAER